jgi:hypothetical protein
VAAAGAAEEGQAPDPFRVRRDNSVGDHRAHLMSGEADLFKSQVIEKSADPGDEFGDV